MENEMTRDLSRKQFAAALKRNGLRQVMAWIDCPAKPGMSVGIIMTKKRGEWKTNYRLSLARAIQEIRP